MKRLVLFLFAALFLACFWLNIRRRDLSASKLHQTTTLTVTESILRLHQHTDNDEVLEGLKTVSIEDALREGGVDFEECVFVDDPPGRLITVKVFNPRRHAGGGIELHLVEPYYDLSRDWSFDKIKRMLVIVYQSSQAPAVEH
jgi:hypothetical protein